jgi:tetratricopeptide (TPR) repeat protein
VSDPDATASQLYKQGLSLGKKGLWSEAEASFRQAARLAPKSSLTWLSAAIACCHQRRYEQAAVEIHWALQVAVPIRATPESEIGIERFAAEDWPGVEEAFTQLLGTDSIDPTTHLFLAIALIRQNRVQEGFDQLMAGYRMEVAAAESQSFE